MYFGACRICYDRCTTLVSAVLRRERGHVGVGHFAFNRYFCDLFYSRIFQSQGCSRGMSGGHVCLSGWGLKPVSGHRDTEAVNRAQTSRGQTTHCQGKIFYTVLCGPGHYGFTEFERNLRGGDFPDFPPIGFSQIFKIVLLKNGWMCLVDIMIFWNQRIDIYKIGTFLGRSESPLF